MQLLAGAGLQALAEFGAQGGTGADGAADRMEVEAGIEPGLPQGRHPGQEALAGCGECLAEAGGEGGGQPVHRQAVAEQLQQGDAEAVGMGDTDRGDGAVELGKAERGVQAVGVGQHLVEREELAAAAARAADGLFDQGRAGWGRAGWHTAFAVGLDHLHGQVVQKAGEQGGGELAGVAAGEVAAAEHRAAFRRAGARGAVEFGKGPGSAGLAQGGGVALGIEDFLPTISKHLTLRAARRYSVERGTVILTGCAATASPGIRAPDFVVSSP